MKYIVLLCANGMSTSLLVKKMIPFTKEENLQLKIEAHPVDDAGLFSNVDCILLGPQVYFLLDKVKKIAKCPVALIEERAYGEMDGKAVIQQARGLMETYDGR